jgi:hypothetical protein
VHVNLAAMARDLAAAEGIPEPLVPAVVHRVQMARRAVIQLDGYEPLGDGARRLVRRVVRGAALDHEAGVLERRVSA